jgi:sec-independent protein translocase protein TatB
MFGVDSSELLLVVLVAVVVLGPKDLPRVMRTLGQWVAKVRGMAGQFRSGVDEMVRDTEIAELEKKWREQNELIMKLHPNAPLSSDWGLTPPPGAAPALPPGGDTVPLASVARQAPPVPLGADLGAATPARAPSPPPHMAAAGVEPSIPEAPPTEIAAPALLAPPASEPLAPGAAPPPRRPPPRAIAP